MSLEDAIMRMEALSHKFFLYLDAEDNLISLLYIRNDGDMVLSKQKIK